LENLNGGIYEKSSIEATLLPDIKYSGPSLKKKWRSDLNVVFIPIIKKITGNHP
jgi:hypothetical protein